MTLEIFKIFICKFVAFSPLNNVWLFVLARAHCFGHIFLELLRPRCSTCLSVNWDTLRDSFFNVMVNSFFGKSSLCLFSVQVDTAVISDYGLVLSRHYALTNIILINVVFTSLIRLMCSSWSFLPEWRCWLRNTALIRARRLFSWRCNSFFRVFDNSCPLCFPL